MKQECPTYLKSTATLSDTELEIESDDSDDDGILNAFTATVDPTEGVTDVGNMYIHSGKLNGSTSFTIYNMHSVNLRIQV